MKPLASLRSMQMRLPPEVRRRRRRVRRATLRAEWANLLERRAGLVWGVAVLASLVGLVLAWRWPGLVPRSPWVGGSIALGGLITGVLLGAAADTTDRLVRGARHVWGVGAELVAVLPPEASSQAGAQLAASISAARPDEGVLKIALTAARTGAFGVSPWAEALGTAVAQQGASVLVVDLVTGLTDRDGAAEVAAGRRKLGDVARLSEGLRYARIGPGRDHQDAIAGLGALMDRLPRDLDVVIVAMPPMVTPAVVEATLALDAVLVVAEKDRTTRIELLSALEAVARIREPAQVVLFDGRLAEELGHGAGGLGIGVSPGSGRRPPDRFADHAGDQHDEDAGHGDDDFDGPDDDPDGRGGRGRRGRGGRSGKRSRAGRSSRRGASTSASEGFSGAAAGGAIAGMGAAAGMATGGAIRAGADAQAPASSGSSLPTREGWVPLADTQDVWDRDATGRLTPGDLAGDSGQPTSPATEEIEPIPQLDQSGPSEVAEVAGVDESDQPRHDHEPTASDGEAPHLSADDGMAATSHTTEPFPPVEFDDDTLLARARERVAKRGGVDDLDDLVAWTPDGSDDATQVVQLPADVADVERDADGVDDEAAAKIVDAGKVVGAAEAADSATAGAADEPVADEPVADERGAGDTARPIVPADDLDGPPVVGGRPDLAPSSIAESLRQQAIDAAAAASAVADESIAERDAAAGTRQHPGPVDVNPAEDTSAASMDHDLPGDSDPDGGGLGARDIDVLMGAAAAEAAMLSEVEHGDIADAVPQQRTGPAAEDPADRSGHPADLSGTDHAADQAGAGQAHQMDDVPDTEGPHTKHAPSARHEEASLGETSVMDTLPMRVDAPADDVPDVSPSPGQPDEASPGRPGDPSVSSYGTAAGDDVDEVDDPDEILRTTAQLSNFMDDLEDRDR